MWVRCWQEGELIRIIVKKHQIILAVSMLCIFYSALFKKNWVVVRSSLRFDIAILWFVMRACDQSKNSNAKRKKKRANLILVVVVVVIKPIAIHQILKVVKDLNMSRIWGNREEKNILKPKELHPSESFLQKVTQFQLLSLNIRPRPA